MLLNKIQDNIGAYKKWLQSLRFHPHVYKWESVQIFQNQWDLNDKDPVAMFDRAIHNTETRRLWQTENWYPKRIMLEFWRYEPQSTRMMFDDLFNETREVEGRIGRFVFGCDALLRDYKSDHPATVENNHYHGDYRMIALYLAFRYPEAYAPYDFPVFQKALVALGARDIPQQNDLGRYFKVLRTLMNFLEKDAEVPPLLHRQLNAKKHYMGKTLLLAEDFCGFIANKG
jgi:hypothetical protein